MSQEKINKGFATMFKGGVIMDVTTVEQAKVAENAGACAVMALDVIPADIRKLNGVCRMASLQLIKDIKNTVSIPVMAKCRIGHFVEAQILQQANVDFIDESEVLTPADHFNHIDKTKFKTPFVCGARNLGEAVRRINEGASMIRTKGEAGTGDISQAVKHVTTIQKEIEALKDVEDLTELATEYRVPKELLEEVKSLGRLTVVNFAAGGVATPADAALMMKMGCDGVFVGSGIFKSSDPPNMADAVVKAVTHFEDLQKLYECCMQSGSGMKGINSMNLKEEDTFEGR
ncbi:SOR/SNZ family [seawater metagenome]|uniref:pyridoxal 5'-phosphate synthase (glutamine hydrolyzing) n=1 Tax=seawater metagenome TaxID=1561972 RepID=A0A5E8CLY4_9ZZZZ